MRVMRTSRLFTSESVTEGHPDKICDQIADAVLDEVIRHDPFARVACEVCATTNMILVMGEVTPNACIDVPGIARSVVRGVGYTHTEGFDSETCDVLVRLDEQSPDIDRAVRKGTENLGYDQTGAGDQGMMFGYATNETPELMPLPIVLAHRLTKALADVRKQNILSYLLPDGKAQVTVEYENGVPKRVDTVVLSAQHNTTVTQARLIKELTDRVIVPSLPAEFINDSPRILVNPSGRFVIGGPAADSGLTGRKLIADTYGGMCRHGGGALSGKDPTKVDRSAAYAARYAAKNLVAAGAASRCEVQVAYAIGVAKPVAVSVDTFGTGLVPDSVLEAIAMKVFDFRPAAIIEKFGLRQPMYRQVACYGHFGRPELGLPWEQLDAVDDILQTL